MQSLFHQQRDENAARVLDFYVQRHCSPQWRHFLASFAARLFQDSGQEDARRFLQQIGSQMASSLPLPAADTLEELQGAINFVLDQIDWGWVRLREQERYIEIVHSACPSAIAEDAQGLWTKCMAATLEGLYTSWFHARGSLNHQHTVCIRMIEPGEFELHHGG